jgi:hypothetical protein
MSDLFLSESPFELDFDGSVMEFDYWHAHPKAKADAVVVRKERDDHGAVSSETGFIIVRDSGDMSKMTTRRAVVVRRVNALTPLPENCGRLIGAIESHAGRFAYYVFDAKEGSPSPRSSAAETTPPSPSIEPDIAPPCAASPSSRTSTTQSAPDSAGTDANSDAWPGW